MQVAARGDDIFGNQAPGGCPTGRANAMSAK